MTSTTGDDPVYEAIENHERTELLLSLACLDQHALERKLPRGRTRSLHHDNVAERLNDDPSWIVAVERVREASDEAFRAAIALVNTIPTTVAGVESLLHYVGGFTEAGREWPELGDSEELGVQHATCQELAFKNAAKALHLILNSSTERCGLAIGSTNPPKRAA